jgi:hypothetical protein
MSSRAFLSTSSCSRSAVLTFVTAEASSAAWASCSRSSSRTTCSWYSSHPLSVRRASTRASRASYWSWYQLRLKLS